jgi:hypothetical protein
VWNARSAARIRRGCVGTGAESFPGIFLIAQWWGMNYFLPVIRRFNPLIINRRLFEESAFIVMVGRILGFRIRKETILP